MSSINPILKVIVLCCLFLCACTNSDKSSGESEQINNDTTLGDSLGELVLRDFSGKVTDENNKPIENVIITIGDKVAQTDNDGRFKIKNANVREGFTSIEATKENYKKNTINVVPEDKINTTLIVLTKDNDSCLFWFCRHNHSLPNSDN